MKELSDFELNKAIAEALGLKIIDWYDGQFIVNDNGNHIKIDYCNNFNDLMPLVEKYRLVIVPYKDDLWEAYPEGGEFVIYNKKYLRAGAECLLKVLEATEKDLKTTKDIKVFYGPMARYPYLY